MRKTAWNWPPKPSRVSHCSSKPAPFFWRTLPRYGRAIYTFFFLLFTVTYGNTGVVVIFTEPMLICLCVGLIFSLHLPGSPSRCGRRHRHRITVLATRSVRHKRGSQSGSSRFAQGLTGQGQKCLCVSCSLMLLFSFSCFVLEREVLAKRVFLAGPCLLF